MPVISMGKGAVAWDTAATKYFPIISNGDTTTGGAAESANWNLETYNLGQILIGITVHSGGAGSNTQNAVVTTWVNGAAGNISATVGAGMTGYFHSSGGVDNLTEQGTLSARGTSAAGSGTINISVTAHVLCANGVDKYLCLNFGTYVQPASTTQYWGIVGVYPDVQAGNASDLYCSVSNTGSPASLNRLSLYVSASNTNLAMTLTLNKNGTDTTQTISVTASTTGRFRCVADAVSVINGDYLQYKTVSPGFTGSVTITSAQICWHSPNADPHEVCSMVAGGPSGASFTFLDGGPSQNTIGYTGYYLYSPQMLTNMWAKIYNNTITAASTLQLLGDSSSQPAPIVTVPASTSGRFYNNTDVYVGGGGTYPNSYLSFLFLCGASGTSLFTMNFGIIGYYVWESMAASVSKKNVTLSTPSLGSAKFHRLRI
jgi:hypothetical protein